MTNDSAGERINPLQHLQKHSEGFRLNRRTFVSSLGAAAISMSASEALSFVAGKESAVQVHNSLSYASGIAPPSNQPMLTIRSTVIAVSTFDFSIMHPTGPMSFLYEEIRFSWKLIRLPRAHVHEHIQVGDEVVLVGTTGSSDRIFKDLQQLWINPPIDPAPQNWMSEVAGI